VERFALAFAHEPADRVEMVLETMRKDIANDMTEIFDRQKAEDIAGEWIKVLKMRIAEFSTLQPGVA